MVTMEEAEALAALTLLNDDVRRALYRFVRESPGPVTREEAAKAVRVSAKLAAFHLDKLVDGDLLEAGYEAPRGLRRRVGRAPKRYRPSDLEVSLSVPSRRYDLVGEILVDGIAGAGGSLDPMEAARHAAFDKGCLLGTQRRENLHRGRLGAERTVGEARALLQQLGFEPADDAAGLVLRNCPFHALAQRSPQVVCALNAAFVDGVLRGLGNQTVSAELVPEDGLCCVRVVPPSH